MPLAQATWVFVTQGFRYTGSCYAGLRYGVLHFITRTRWISPVPTTTLAAFLLLKLKDSSNNYTGSIVIT